MSADSGPLTGIRIVEFAGIGPGPFAGMMLADMGAEILRIDRRGAVPATDPKKDIPARGRQSITLDLKKPAAADVALQLIERADGLIEGFRPGVMERLGLGPETCHARNPGLVYGRMTGWGQTGPLAHAAGHDMNYIALSGALWSIGEAGRDPVPPLNLIGDFGGGGMLLAFGMVCGLLRARQTGTGDVVDAAMCDGAAALMAPVYGYLAKDIWQNRRGSNFLDGAAPYYAVYRCKDGKWISVAPIEPQFYALLLELLELPADDIGDRENQKDWPQQKARFAEIFLRKTRSEWCDLLEGTDVCFAPVLDLEEAPHHSHNKERSIFVEGNGLYQPAPAPRFQNAPVTLPGPPPSPGEHNETALMAWGFDRKEIDALQRDEII